MGDPIKEFIQTAYSAVGKQISDEEIQGLIDDYGNSPYELVDVVGGLTGLNSTENWSPDLYVKGMGFEEQEVSEAPEITEDFKSVVDQPIPTVTKPAEEKPEFLDSQSFDFAKQGINDTEKLEYWGKPSKTQIRQIRGDGPVFSPLSTEAVVAERQAEIEKLYQTPLTEVRDPYQIFDGLKNEYGNTKAYELTKNFIDLEQSVRRKQIESDLQKYNNFFAEQTSAFVQDMNQSLGYDINPEDVTAYDLVNFLETNDDVLNMMSDEGKKIYERMKSKRRGLDVAIGLIESQDKAMKEYMRTEKKGDEVIQNIQSAIDLGVKMPQDVQLLSSTIGLAAPEWLQDTYLNVSKTLATTAQKIVNSFTTGDVTPEDFEGDIKERWDAATTKEERNKILVEAAAQNKVDRKKTLTELSKKTSLQGMPIERQVPLSINGKDYSVVVTGEGDIQYVRGNDDMFVTDPIELETIAGTYNQLKDSDKIPDVEYDFNLNRSLAFVGQIVSDMAPAIGLSAAASYVTGGLGGGAVAVRVASIFGQSFGTFSTVYADFYDRALEENPANALEIAMTQSLATAAIENIGGLESRIGRQLGRAGINLSDDAVRRSIDDYARQVVGGRKKLTIPNILEESKNIIKKHGKEIGAEYLEEEVDQFKERTLDNIYNYEGKTWDLLESVNTFIGVAISTPVVGILGAGKKANEGPVVNLIQESLAEPEKVLNSLEEAFQRQTAVLEERGDVEGAERLSNRVQKVRDKINDVSNEYGQIIQEFEGVNVSSTKLNSLKQAMAQLAAEEIRIEETTSDKVRKRIEKRIAKLNSIIDNQIDKLNDTQDQERVQGTEQAGQEPGRVQDEGRGPKATPPGGVLQAQEEQQEDTAAQPQEEVETKGELGVVKQPPTTLFDIYDSTTEVDGRKEAAVRDKDGNEGTLSIDEGGKVTVTIGDQIRELGNVEELYDKPLSEIYEGLTPVAEVKAAGDFRYSIDGGTYVNRYSNPEAAINYDENGNVVSVDLEKRTTVGGYGGIETKQTYEKQTFTGAQAQELALQIKLENLEKNGQNKQFTDFLEAKDRAGQIQESPSGTTAEAATGVRTEPQGRTEPTTTKTQAKRVEPKVGDTIVYTKKDGTQGAAYEYKETKDGPRWVNINSGRPANTSVQKALNEQFSEQAQPTPTETAQAETAPETGTAEAAPETAPETGTAETAPETGPAEPTTKEPVTEDERLLAEKEERKKKAKDSITKKFRRWEATLDTDTGTVTLGSRSKEDLQKAIDSFYDNYYEVSETTSETTTETTTETAAEPVEKTTAEKDAEESKKPSTVKDAVSVLKKRFGVTREPVTEAELAKQITKAIKSLSELAPGIKFVMLSDKEFVRITGKRKSSAQYNSGGNVIYINKDKARRNTVFHEAAHVAFVKLFGVNTKEANQKVVSIHKAIEGVLKNGNAYEKNLAAKLQSFIKSYENHGKVEYLQSHEFFAELLGTLAAESKRLKAKPSTIKKMVKAINDAIEAIISIRPLEEGSGANIQEILDLVNSLATAFETGAVITGETVATTTDATFEQQAGIVDQNNIENELRKVTNITDSQAKGAAKLITRVQRNIAKRLGKSLSNYRRTRAIKTVSNLKDIITDIPNSIASLNGLSSEIINDFSAITSEKVSVLFQNIYGRKPEAKFIKNQGLAENDYILGALLSGEDGLSFLGFDTKLSLLKSKEEIRNEINNRLQNILERASSSNEFYITEFSKGFLESGRDKSKVQSEKDIYQSMLDGDQRVIDMQIEHFQSQQRFSLLSSLNYLYSSAEYSPEFKYLMSGLILKGNVAKDIETTDKKTNVTRIIKGPKAKRNNKTVGNHQELSSMVLPSVYRDMMSGASEHPMRLIEKHTDKSYITREETQEIIKDRIVKKTDGGYWVRFEKSDSPTDIAALTKVSKKVAKVMDKNPWCTGGGMADTYLPRGDFYLFLNSELEPQITVRYEGDRITELKGTDSGQELSEKQAFIADDFLNDIPNGSAYKNQVKATIIYHKLERGEELSTKQDLIDFLDVYSIDLETHDYDKVEEFNRLKKENVDQLVKLNDKYKVYEDIITNNIFIPQHFEAIKPNSLVLGDAILFGQKLSDAFTIPEGVTFKGTVDFDESQFSGPFTISEGVTFNGYVGFNKSQFSGPFTISEGVTFNRRVDFTRSQFSDSFTISEGVTFNRGINFYKSEFSKPFTISEGVTFNGMVDFSRAKISDSFTISEGVTFNGAVDFSESQFSDAFTIPKGITFNSSVYFNESQFSGPFTISEGVRFNSSASFIRSQFSGPFTISEDVTFNGIVYFNGAQFQDSFIISRGVSFNNILFTGAYFYKPLKVSEDVYFNGDVLYETGFLVNEGRELTISDFIKKDLDQYMFQQEGRAAIIETPTSTLILLDKDNADITSPMHEVAHEYEKVLTKEERKALEEWSGKKAGTRAFSEAFAKGAELYIYEGSTFNSKLDEIFDKFKQWFRGVINDAISYFGDVNQLNDDVRLIYAQMLMDGDAKLAETQPEQAAQPLREDLAFDALNQKDAESLNDDIVFDQLEDTLEKNPPRYPVKKVSGKTGLRRMRVGNTNVFFKDRINPITDKPTGEIELDLMETDPDKLGQGSARAALDAFLEYTDSIGKTVYLVVSPRTPETKFDRLVEFYSSVGFRDIGTGFEMIRGAKGKVEGRDIFFEQKEFNEGENVTVSRLHKIPGPGGFLPIRVLTGVVKKITDSAILIKDNILGNKWIPKSMLYKDSQGRVLMKDEFAQRFDQRIEDDEAIVQARLLHLQFPDLLPSEIVEALNQFGFNITEADFYDYVIPEKPAPDINSVTSAENLVKTVLSYIPNADNYSIIQFLESQGYKMDPNDIVKLAEDYRRTRDFIDSPYTSDYTYKLYTTLLSSGITSQEAIKKVAEKYGIPSYNEKYLTVVIESLDQENIDRINANDGKVNNRINLFGNKIVSSLPKIVRSLGALFNLTGENSKIVEEMKKRSEYGVKSTYRQLNLILGDLNRLNKKYNFSSFDKLVINDMLSGINAQRLRLDYIKDSVEREKVRRELQQITTKYINLKTPFSKSIARLLKKNLPGAISEYKIDFIMENDNYVTRVYLKYEEGVDWNKDLMDEINPGLWTRAKEFFTHQQKKIIDRYEMKEAAGEELTVDEKARLKKAKERYDNIEKYMNELLDVEESPISVMGDVLQIKANEANLKYSRESLPEIFREFIGEVKDPAANISMTTRRLAEIASALQLSNDLKEFNDQLIARGEEPILSPTKTSTHTEKLTTENTTKFYLQSLFGENQKALYVSPEVYGTLMTRHAPPTNRFVKIAGYFGSMVKMGWTVLSERTQLKNFVGALFMVHQTGNIPTPKSIRQAKALLDLNSSNPKTRAKARYVISQLDALGITGQTIIAEEFDYFKNAFFGEGRKPILDYYLNAEKKLNLIAKAQKKAKNLVHKPVEAAKYLYTLGDDIPKIMAFVGEANKHLRSYGIKDSWVTISDKISNLMFDADGNQRTDLTTTERSELRSLMALKAQSEKDAAKTIRAIIPNYNEMWRVAKWFQKNTSIGTFTSFNFETIRTKLNIYKIGWKELQNSRTRQMGAAKLISVTGSLLASYNFPIILSTLFGYDDDDQEKLAALTPDYYTNPIITDINEETGDITIVNTNNADPNSLFSNIWYAALGLRRRARGQTSNVFTSIFDVGYEIVSPFFNLEIIPQAFIYLFTNRDQYDDKITDVEWRNNEFKYTREVLKKLTKDFKPGFAKSLDQVSLKNWVNNASTEAEKKKRENYFKSIATFGATHTTVNRSKLVYYKLSDIGGYVEDPYNDVYSSWFKDKSYTKDMKDKIEYADLQYRIMLREAAAVVDAGYHFGMSENEIKKTLSNITYINSKTNKSYRSFNKEAINWLLAGKNRNSNIPRYVFNEPGSDKYYTADRTLKD